MTEITTNDRFDQLTNLDIKTHYKDIEFFASPSDFLGAFVYWVTAQNPNKELIDLRPALAAFESHVLRFFEKPTLPEKFDFMRLQDLINEELFASTPEILALNELKPDFIDLGALSRNVFYMVLREKITQCSGD